MDTHALFISGIMVFMNTLIVYFLTNNFCGFKSSIAIKKIKLIPSISILAIYTIFHVLTLYFLPLGVYHNLNLFALLILTWLFVEKRKVSFATDEIAIIWLSIFAIVHFFLPLPVIARNFISNDLIVVILTFLISSIVVVVLCEKVDFNRFLVFILRRITLRILIFLTVIICLVILTILKLNNPSDLVEHSLLVLVLFIPSLLGLIHTIRLTHQSTAIVPDAYHDAKKLLMLLDIKAEEATDFTQLNEMLAHSVDLMNLQLPDYDLPVSNAASADFEKFIIRTIESIKMDKKANAHLVPNIQFTDKHEKVGDIKIAYMVGLLLEYALDTLTKRPIFIDVASAKYDAVIRVSCEYKFETRFKNTDIFLLEGEAVRTKIKKSFNLSKLESMVNANNGELKIAREKNNQEQVDYLSIHVVFKKEGGSLV